MAVVVTGAAGFIGTQLVARLLRDGHHVIGIDRRLGVPSGAVALRGELSTPTHEMLDALRRADAVFHLAGCPGVRGSGSDLAARRWRDNVLAGDIVLGATPASTPLVVTSSSSVYGGATVTADAVRACREDDRLNPRGGYARSKAVLEAHCAERAHSGGRVTVVRPFTVAGEGQRPDMAIATWIAAALRQQPLTILGSPHRLRDITDVRDVVEGLVRAAHQVQSQVINLGTGVGHRLSELAAAVQRVMGVRVATQLQPAYPAEVVATLADTSRCRAILNFVPRTDLDDVVRRQVAAHLSTVPATTRLLEIA